MHCEISQARATQVQEGCQLIGLVRLVADRRSHLRQVPPKLSPPSGELKVYQVWAQLRKEAYVGNVSVGRVRATQEVAQGA